MRAGCFCALLALAAGRQATESLAAAKGTPGQLAAALAQLESTGPRVLAALAVSGPVLQESQAELLEGSLAALASAQALLLRLEADLGGWHAAGQAPAAIATQSQPPEGPVEEGPDRDSPLDYLTSLSDNLGPFILASLGCVALAIFKGAPPPDLFSADVHSQLEAALAFTLASLTALGLIYGRITPTVSSNPISLYLWELFASFLAVSTTIPMLLGTSRRSPKAAAVASTVAVVYYGGLWLSSDTPVLWCFLKPRSFAQKDPDFLGPAIVLSLLYLALLVVNGLKLARVLGATGRAFRPFHAVWLQRCRSYISGRVRGKAVELPVPLPAALLVPVLAVLAAMCNAVFLCAFLGWRRYEELRGMAQALLGPVALLFGWMGHPLDMGELERMQTRVMLSFFTALFLAAVYIAWLLRMVVVGYKRVFRDLATGKGYHGQELAATAGPAVFHPQWASYSAGALVGNAAMALFLILVLVWLTVLVLIMPQFWAMQWNIRSWWIFYGLLYATRKCIFLFVIPRYVVTDDGVVIRRRLWALLFPTLLLLNFVLGATSGVIRFAVMFPYLLCQFFRVDITFLPGPSCGWDWSYQPFLCLVLHAHRRLNPILQATVSAFGELPPQANEQPEETGETDVEASNGSSSARSGARRVQSAPLPGSRARQRWHLALVLVRNPALRSLRCPEHPRSVASAPGRMERVPAGSQAAAQAQGPEPLQIEAATGLALPLGPRAAPQRLDSCSSFYSPLNAETLGRQSSMKGASLPLLASEGGQGDSTET